MKLFNILLLFLLIECSIGSSKLRKHHRHGHKHRGRGRLRHHFIKHWVAPHMSHKFEDGLDTMGHEQCGKCASGGGGDGGIRDEADLMIDKVPKHKSNNIAENAAEEAKAARNRQDCDARTASNRVKGNIAKKVYLAAKVAEAALAGKQQLVDQLKQKLCEAKDSAQEQRSSLYAMQTNAHAAVKAAKAARKQHCSLKQVVEVAYEHVGNAKHVADMAQMDVLEKRSVLDASESSLELLMRQLRAARKDLARTKEAACKAATAAQEARENVAKDCN